MGRLTHLLDTNILSEPLAMRPNAHVLQQIAAHQGTLATSAISWQEMLFEMYRLPPSKKRAQVGHFLMQRVKGVLPILPFDEDAGRWQAEQRARLTAVGKTPSYVDSQIAAIAVINGLALVTRNTQDFADFNDLGLENWFKE